MMTTATRVSVKLSGKKRGRFISVIQMFQEQCCDCTPLRECRLTPISRSIAPKGQLCSGQAAFNHAQNRDSAFARVFFDQLVERRLPFVHILLPGKRHQLLPAHRLLRSDTRADTLVQTFTLQKICCNFREGTQGGLHGRLVWEHAAMCRRGWVQGWRNVNFRLSGPLHQRCSNLQTTNEPVTGLPPNPGASAGSGIRTTLLRCSPASGQPARSGRGRHAWTRTGPHRLVRSMPPDWQAAGRTGWRRCSASLPPAWRMSEKPPGETGRAGYCPAP